MTDIKPMEEFTVKELQAEATKLGMVDAELLTTKKQLIAIINTLRAKKLVADETPIAPVVDNKKKDEKQYVGKAMRMKARLDAQPKVRVFLPLEGKEKKGEFKKAIINGKETTIIVGAYKNVTLNGYKTTIPKGVPFEVALQVAEELGQSQVATAEAGSQFLLDRNENVQKALS